jgi:hypothetical protein
MEVDFIFKIAAIGIIVAALSGVVALWTRGIRNADGYCGYSRNSDDAAAGYRGASQHHRINL